ANRSWSKERGIRLSGPPLGRPKQDPTVQAQLKQQARADEKIRVAIEGKFGQAKRRFSLARVMPKLAQTAQCAIAITFLVMNLECWLRQLLFLLFGRYGCGLGRWSALIWAETAIETVISRLISQFSLRRSTVTTTQKLALA
ncbi:MAG: transposase, partial [Cyanobacteria bacterium J06632_3]